MGYAIEFEYSFGIRYPSGETREGGANALVSIDTADAEALGPIDLYAIAYESVLDEVEAIWGEEEEVATLPDITISIRNLTVDDEFDESEYFDNEDEEEEDEA
ncbi:MAG: hypothetical protein IPL78_07255 [Chloroflexi bacterium]|nr:hypothetical protein [Chloroflexota bacterium]